MKKRLSASLVAQIRKERARGATYQDLSARHGLSAGTIANALKAAPPKAKARPASPPPPPSDAAPADEGDGVAELLATVERLSAEAEQEKNLAGVATLGRLKVALLEHRRKNRPPPSPEEQGFTLVPTSELTDLGALVEARLLKLVDLVIEDFDPADGAA